MVDDKHLETDLINFSTIINFFQFQLIWSLNFIMEGKVLYENAQIKMDVNEKFNRNNI